MPGVCQYGFAVCVEVGQVQVAMSIDEIHVLNKKARQKPSIRELDSMVYMRKECLSGNKQSAIDRQVGTGNVFVAVGNEKMYCTGYFFY